MHAGQEAAKRARAAPEALQVRGAHLQRFKKLSYRIAFPLELKLTNTAETAAEPDRKYSLFAVVVHVGAGPSHGHYICLVRSHKHWLLFDDDTVDLVEEGSLQSCFGSALESAEVL